MERPGCYLYGIIPSPGERVFDGVAPLGDAGGTVGTICHDGLAAVVSDSSVTEYESSRANMLAHERVLERVMQEFTVLPVRFGTVAGAPAPTEDVGRLLAARSREFHRLLQEVAGRVELGLKVLWRDQELVFNEILAEDGGVRRLRDTLQGKPPAATHYDRIRLGEMIKAAMDRKREAEALRLLAPLRGIADRVVENRTTVDRMVLNAAFLVHRQREAQFDQAVAGLDEEHGDRLALKYVGPAPPYNFVSIVVNWQDL